MPLHSGLRVATSAARRSCGKKCGASSSRFGKSFLSPPSSRSSRPLASCLPALNRSAFSSRSPACFHGLCMGWCSSSPPRARDGKSSVSCGRRRWLSPPNYRRRTKGQEVLRPCPLCCLCLCACLVLTGRAFDAAAAGSGRRARDRRRRASAPLRSAPPRVVRRFAFACARASSSQAGPSMRDAAASGSGRRVGLPRPRVLPGSRRGRSGRPPRAGHCCYACDGPS